MNKLILVFLVFFTWQTGCSQTQLDNKIVSYTVLPSDIQFYWQQNGKNYGSLGRLKSALAKEGKELVFAMNGGMCLPDGKPQGLYVENGRVLMPTDTTQTAYGNFYMQPNGVFYIDKQGKAAVVATRLLPELSAIKYATQSGPMLVIEGELHPKFQHGSTSLYVRNGVGILPDGRLLFAISRQPVNFYTFATFFRDAGCQNALYLDGFVSRMYLPGKNIEQLDGNFGAIIGQTKPISTK